MHFKQSALTWLQGDNNPTVHNAIIMQYAQCRKDVFNPSILFATSAHTTVQ